MTIMATMTFGPFVQAFASKFGEKFAGFIDAKAKSAMRRFISESAGVKNSESPYLRAEVNLDVERTNVRVHVAAEIPPEALVQLIGMNVSGFGRDVVNILWQEGDWWALRIRGKRVSEFIWNPDARRWESPPSPPGIAAFPG
jgi:hypothetical protein